MIGAPMRKMTLTSFLAVGMAWSLALSQVGTAEASVIAYYQFEGDLLTDSSGNGRSLTLTNPVSLSSTLARV